MSRCLAVAAMLAAAPFAVAGAEEITVYTAIEADQLKDYEGAFEAANPDVDIRWVRDSIGIVTAKLLAEKSNPRADVVFGLAATSLMLLQKEGMLDAYAPAGLDKVKPQMRDPADPPSWVGMDVWASAFCFNTIEGEAKKLPKPAGWADLADPIYKGQVAMPNPASSGTARSSTAPTRPRATVPIDRAAERGARLGHGSVGHRQGHRRARSGQEADRLVGDARGGARRAWRWDGRASDRPI